MELNSLDRLMTSEIKYLEMKAKAKEKAMEDMAKEQKQKASMEKMQKLRGN